MEPFGSRVGHIRIVDILGQGGMGDVYAGYDETLHRRVALKAIRPEQRLDTEARARLIREARALSLLDHPNICRIYDYIEGSTVDFLVLEFIEGQTLEQTLSRGLDEPEKLRIATAITGVLVAAHRAGIIHRDLKPDNVMLTSTGQVKVLDFGLARFTESPQSPDRQSSVQTMRIRLPIPRDAKEPALGDWFVLDEKTETAILPLIAAHEEAARNQERGTPLATEAGVTMGTPRYMSPEQARGDSLSPASDMYSLGLMLQTLFTGKEPYDNLMTGRELMAAASRGQSLPMNGADRDVTALVNRLKQLAPTDRPTAVAAEERLRWIADKPKRLLRRVSATVLVLLVLLGSWKYITNLRRERAAALAAETEARARRAQAEDLIGFMLGDLKTKLETVGRLDVLDGVAAKALQYLAAKPKETLSTEELIHHSEALNQLGEVHIARGDLVSAMKVFLRSLDLSQTAVNREPGNNDAEFALAQSHFWIGNDYRLQNDITHALPQVQAYVNVTERLARQNPGRDKYTLEVGYAHSLLGLLFESQLNFEEALAQYRTTLAIKEAQTARHPSSDDAQEDVARTLNKIGLVEEKMGALASSRETFLTEIAIRERLFAHNPRQMRWKQDLAVGHSLLALALGDIGDNTGAIQHRRIDVALHSALCTVDPSNATWHRNLAVGHLKLGNSLFDGGFVNDALAEIRTGEEALAALVLANPGRRSLRADLVAARIYYSEVLLAKHERDAARAKAKEAIVLASAERNPYLLAQANMSLGWVDETAGNHEAARGAWLTAQKVLQPLVVTGDVHTLDLWARVLIALNQRADASQIVHHLRTLGYRGIRFEASARKNGY